MIKVSHEVPLSMLEMSREFNDYDYALVHLFEEHSEYLAFFIESLRLGREVILDNSIFELGTAFDMKEFAGWVERLKPTTHIIPDVLGSATGTLDNLEKWFKDHPNMPGKSMGVVQGSTYETLKACYMAMVDQVDEIALCFHYPYYEQNDEGRMNGRIDLITKFMEEGVIREDKSHHLLGCSLPQEFEYYKGASFIKSLDTSNPIVHGIKEIPYTSFGLDAKESIKLADLIGHIPTMEQMNIIKHNVQMFKDLLK